ncbi:MFS transporter [Kineosporia sp. J2-2]|uniref:MFS transporter n=1 Tax=Kineosporia corallincola TaxID=2835133 RepID=A0ABS5TEG2_9ACTN|nr:MFS transporter [Kineosporia corallincola]MBT0768611.1 MFS transporter [Kineosporia corallincola]
MSRALTLLFAVAGGVAVGNLYWAQPLLDFIAADLNVSSGMAGWLVTLTQIGYAVGVLLIVPLGDVLDRRRLVPTMLGLSAVALLACAVAPSVGFLMVALCAVGLSTVAGQILAPLAGDLASDAERGRVVGTVASGMLTGILISRTVSGLIADIAGWRAIFVVAAAASVLLALLLRRALPVLPAREPVPYGQLLGTVARIVLRERAVRWSLVMGMIGFAVFTMFWTSLTFLLSAPPFSYPVSVIGLFGLAGLAGAVAAQRAGALHDRGWSLPAAGVAWALALVALVVAGTASTSLIAIIVATFLLDAAVQTMNILNQTRIFAVSGQARSRLNTAFVTSNFIGGAVGSATAALLWSHGGWDAVITAAAALVIAGGLVWALGCRGALVVPTRTAPADPGTGR